MQPYAVDAEVARPVLYFAAHSAWFFVTPRGPRGATVRKANQREPIVREPGVGNRKEREIQRRPVRDGP